MVVGEGLSVSGALSGSRLLFGCSLCEHLYWWVYIWARFVSVRTGQCVCQCGHHCSCTCTWTRGAIIEDKMLHLYAFTFAEGDRVAHV